MLKRKRDDAAPDLHSQYESLLDQIWRSEADSEFWARMDAIERQERARGRPKVDDSKRGP